MDLRAHDYEPQCCSEDGNNYSLYYCPICNGDTLHQVIAVQDDNYDVRCSSCQTTSMTRADYFDSYEDEVMKWDQEISLYMDPGGSMY